MGGEGCHQSCVLGGDRIAAAQDHQVQVRKLGPMPAEALADQTLEPVAVDRAAGTLLRDRQPQAPRPASIGPREDGKEGIDRSAGALEDPLKLPLVEQPRRSGKVLVPSARARVLARDRDSVTGVFRA